VRNLFLLGLLILSFEACATNDLHDLLIAKEPETKAVPKYVPDELLVMFREGTTESRMNAINDFLNVAVVRKMLSERLHLIKVPKDKSLEEVRRSYLAFPEVEAIEFNYKVRGQQKGP